MFVFSGCFFYYHYCLSATSSWWNKVYIYYTSVWAQSWYVVPGLVLGLQSIMIGIILLPFQPDLFHFDILNHCTKCETPRLVMGPSAHSANCHSDWFIRSFITTNFHFSYVIFDLKTTLNLHRLNIHKISLP